MVKAPAAEQLRLLDLQALDSKLTQLKRRTREVTEDADIAGLLGQLATANNTSVLANTEVSDAERALSRSEDDVATVVTRLERNRSRLDSGAGNPKDLAAMSHEVESLARRRSALEDLELEAMERLETARSAQGRAQESVDSLQTRMSALEEKRDAELAGISAERHRIQAERSELAETFEEALLTAYEKTLAQRGIGAARLFHGRSEGSGMELSPGDLADIRKASEDDVLLCPDSGCILVRSPDWGN